MVFERKGVISKYCGIRGYGIFVRKVVFLPGAGLIGSSIFCQRTLRWFWGSMAEPPVRRVLAVPIRVPWLHLCGWDVCDWGTGNL